MDSWLIFLRGLVVTKFQSNAQGGAKFLNIFERFVSVFEYFYAVFECFQTFSNIFERFLQKPAHLVLSYFTQAPPFNTKVSQKRISWQPQQR